jgi:hypothetical protein
MQQCGTQVSSECELCSYTYLHEKSSICKYCILIHKLSYTNPRLSSASENKVIALYKEHVQITQFSCQCFYHTISEQTELLLLKADLLCTDWYSHTAELNSAVNSTEKKKTLQKQFMK